MGYVMRLFSSSWCIRLVLSCFFVLFSSYSFSVPNCKAWSVINKDSFSEHPKGSSQIKTSCKLINNGSMGYTLCGSRDKPINDTYTISDDTGFTIYNRFVEKGYFHNGYNQFDEQYSFGVNLKGVYKNALLPSLIKALNNNNCDIANAILDAMQNPNIVKDGDSEFLGFKNGEDKCAVTSDGKTVCRGPSFKTGKGKDGETRLDIDPSGDWEKSLDDYASTKPSDNINNPGSPGNDKGDGSGVNKRKGSGSSSDKKGDSDNGNNKQGDKGSDKKEDKPGNGGSGGSGIGQGSGKGSGDGEGDDEGNSDKNLPELEEFDLDKLFKSHKESLNKFTEVDFQMPSGNCEPITISAFKTSISVDLHCQVIDKARADFESAFIMVWAFLGVIIVLSA